MFHHVVAHASTWPFPIPQELNLSLCFTLDPRAAFKDWQGWQENDLFIAAPEFLTPRAHIDDLCGDPPTPRDDARDRRRRTLKTGAGAAVLRDEAQNIVRQEYDGTDPAIFAYLNAWAYQEPPDSKNRFFDVATYWIKPFPEYQALAAGEAAPAPPRPDWHGEDWLAELPGRAAGVFDLAALLIRAGQSASAQAAPGTLGRDRVIAALRDRASTGLRPEPGGGSLAAAAVRSRRNPPCRVDCFALAERAGGCQPQGRCARLSSLTVHGGPSL